MTTARNLEAVASKIMPFELDRGHAPLAQGPEDAKFILTRPFATPIAIFRVVGDRLVNYTSADPLDPHTDFLLDTSRGKVLTRLRQGGNIFDPRSVSEFRVHLPLNHVWPSNMRDMDDLSATLHSKEALIVEFGSDSRFKSFQYRTYDPDAYRSVTGSTRDLKQNEQLVFELGFKNGKSMVVEFKGGGRASFDETVGSPRDLKGQKPPRDIIEDAMRRFDLLVRSA